MKKHTRLILATLLTALAGVAYWYMGAGKGSTPALGKTPPPVPVTTATSRLDEMPQLLTLVGRAEAYEGVTLKSRLDGQVQSVLYTEGQAVKQGDVLVRLDPADYQARLLQAEAVLARDQAQWAKTRADVARYQSLKEKGFVSDEKVNEVRTAEAAAAANVKADQAAVELARLQLSYTTIRAPFAGVVGARLVFPGSAVKINDTALAVVNRVKPLYVSFSVPERQLPALRRAMKDTPLAVRVTLPGSKDEVFEGKARFIDNAVDAATGTILMKAVVDNADGRLTPGQFLNVSMTLDTLKDAVLVPNEAVQQGPEGNFLYVVNGDETVASRKIELRASHRGQSAIGAGLAAGEVVVTDGQLRLTPGARVVVKPGKTDAAPAAPSATPAR